ncbi:MAG: hypothetical protein CO093_02235 [Alphaproteobacteria bacterium CG_4_9_14_3_um_filter_47_13]|nr:MAG: hypothetical protein CO093_02235 [Alphaproteobacteria bacterium CG_4_9_14_3_um_filter_47_13]
MKNEITITMKLFGAFRPYGDTVEFQICAGSCARTVKNALGNVLGEQAHPLIADSVIANNETILPDDYVIGDDAQLSILPPVCGG